MNTVSIIKTHWYLVGTKLNISEESLKTFWEETSYDDLLSKNVYCCCKMLSYWHKEAKDVTIKNFLNAVSFGPLGFGNKLHLLESILLGQIKTANPDTTPNEVDEVEKSYAMMIGKVTRTIARSGIDVSVFKEFLDHCKSSQTNKGVIDKKMYENATTFSGLVAALEGNGFVSHTELSWLKCLVSDVAKNDQAANDIKAYEQLNISHKLHWHSLSRGAYPHGSLLMAKTILDPAMISGSDISKAKSAVTKIASIDETKASLHSVSVGSVIIYWKLSCEMNIEIPKFITTLCKEQCSAAGITHVGTVSKQRAIIIELQERKLNLIFYVLLFAYRIL